MILWPGVPQVMGTLQGQISANSALAVPNSAQRLPHHPINCEGHLEFFEDGTFRCPHTECAPDDARTQAALNSSVAYLLFEVLFERERRQAS